MKCKIFLAAEFKSDMKISNKSAGIFFASAFMLGAALFAQTLELKRTEVTRSDISVPGKEAIVMTIDFPVGASAGRHTHFGEEIAYVIAGEGELLIDGQSARKLKAGDGFIVPAGAIHDARSIGNMPMKLSSVFVVEKGKALRTAAK
jgi:quercetin dioxygenase-like cupin family protein